MNNKALNVLWDFDQAVYSIGHAVKEEEPLNYALATIKEHIAHILGLFPDRQWAKLFISGKNNFRDKIATLKVYKGNRDPSMRPKYYDELRKYVIDHHGAIVVDGMEAEDACGIEQWKHKDKSTVIISVDKDLDMIPGFRYNPHPKHMDLKYIPLADANYNFWKQVLTGDPTDNIQGIPKIGPKTAEKILAKSDKSWVDMASIVKDEYIRYYGNDGPRNMHEVASLVYILREEGIGYDGNKMAN